MPDGCLQYSQIISVKIVQISFFSHSFSSNKIDFVTDSLWLGVDTSCILPLHITQQQQNMQFFNAQWIYFVIFYYLHGFLYNHDAKDAIANLSVYLIRRHLFSSCCQCILLQNYAVHLFSFSLTIFFLFNFIYDVCTRMCCQLKNRSNV